MRMLQLCYWNGFLEGRWGKESVFFLISAQACLFCRRPGVLPRRKISKSSMPIMNKSSIYLKEWNLFSVVWIKCARLKETIIDLHLNWCPQRKDHITQHPLFFPYTNPYPYSLMVAVVEFTGEMPETKLSWLPGRVTLGMSVSFSICCFYVVLE